MQLADKTQLADKMRLVPRLRDRRRGARRLPTLLFLTDARRVADSASAIAALPAGCGVVLRDYERPDRARWAKALIGVCRRQKRLVLVAGDARLALAWGADGVHLPHGRVRPGRRPKPGWLVTAAAHSRAEAVAARRAAVDAVMLSPLFVTKSHPDAAPLGLLRFRALARAARRPVIALGGLDAASARRLCGIRLAALAAIGGLVERETIRN